MNLGLEKDKVSLVKLYSVRNEDKSESVVIVYKDENGNKKRDLIPRALAPYYIIKDKESHEAKHQPMFIERDKVEKKLVYKDSLLDAIARDVKMTGYLDKCRIEGKYAREKNLFKQPWVYNADMDTSDYYISQFNKDYGRCKDTKLHKGYFDIEVDVIDHVGFPNEDIAPAPINIISYFNEPDMTVYSFILRNEKNPQIKEFEEVEQFEFKEYLTKKFSEEDGIDIAEFDFQFYDEEIELIKAFFETIHDIDPDYMLAWNMVFDVKTMMNRLKQHYGKQYNDYESHMKVMEVFCDDKYLHFDKEDKQYDLRKQMYYKASTNINVTEDRTDYFDISDGINWMDAMYSYANIRKGQTKKDSYALDAVLSDELGKHKLDLGKGVTIKTVPWKNFKRFVEYNIRDILLMYLLERKNLDMDMLHTLSFITNTRINKVLKKSISITNFINKFTKEHDLIMRNNINLNYGDDTLFDKMVGISRNTDLDADKLTKHFWMAYDHNDGMGAYVGDPLLNAPNGKEIFKGKPSGHIYENVIDEDLRSLYPSIIIGFNLDGATEIGRFFFISKDIRNKLEDKYRYNSVDGFADLIPVDSEADKYDDVMLHFTDSILSQDWNNIGEKYFDLPNTEELLNQFYNENKE